MLIKENDKQISFFFYEADPFFDMGCELLEQEHIELMLPYKRKQQNGRERLIFSTESNTLVKLADTIHDLGEGTIIDLLYEIFFLNEKIEENGLLKKECIWYHYDQLYYDRDRGELRVIVLPVTEEAKNKNHIDWQAHFEETLDTMIGFLSKKKAKQIKDLFSAFWSGRITQEDVLRSLDQLGCNVSGVLSNQLDRHQDTALKLIYSGKNNRIEFNVGDKEFLIGRDAKEADGVITEEVSKAVSRKHCLITKMQKKYFVQDLESVNRTLVNGIMIPPYELMELEDNAILSVADIEFRVKIFCSIKGKFEEKSDEREIFYAY